GERSGAATLVEGARLAREQGRSGVLRRAAITLADAADGRPELRAAARELVEEAAAVTGTDDGDDDARAEGARLVVRRLRLGGHPPGPLDPEGFAALHRRVTARVDPRALDERARLADELAVLASAAGDPAQRVLAAHEQAMAAATRGDARATR